MNMITIIKSRMEALGLGQVAVAERAGYTQAFISQLLNGKRAFEDKTLVDILHKALKFSMKETKNYIAQYRIAHYSKWLLKKVARKRRD